VPLLGSVTFSQTSAECKISVSHALNNSE